MRASNSKNVRLTDLARAFIQNGNENTHTPHILRSPYYVLVPKKVTLYNNIEM